MSGKILEDAHREAARATGRMSMMLAKKQISREGVLLSISELLTAVKKLREIAPK